MDDIWVICIKYDYGVWDEAGFFTSEESANLWIQTEHMNEKAEYDEVDKDWDHSEWGTHHLSLTQFYPVRVKKIHQ